MGQGFNFRMGREVGGDFYTQLVPGESTGRPTRLSRNFQDWSLLPPTALSPTLVPPCSSGRWGGGREDTATAGGGHDQETRRHMAAGL